MHLNVYQTREVSEQNVNSNTIKKLYNIVYKDRIGTELLDNNSNLYGKVNSGYTYRKYIDTIYEKYPKDAHLEITPLGLYIYFEDKTVEQILLDNFASGEEGILETLNVHVSNGFYANNKPVFAEHTEIETFDELGQLINVKKLGDSSFRNCTNLRSIDLSKLISISSSAFRGCTSLKIDLNTPNLNTIGTDAFRESGITSILNLGSVSTISDNVFRSCESLTSINLDSANIIGGMAFMDCINLSEVINTQNLIQIGNYAFSGCSSLPSFIFNENITSLGDGVFSRCTSLVIDNLSLPNLTYIGTSAFRETKLKKVSNLGNITEIKNDTFKNCSTLTSVTLPATVTSLWGRAFDGCTLLSELNNINNITSLGGYVFDGCNSLTLNVSQMTSLTSIGEKAFGGVNITGTLDLTNVTSIHNRALAGSKIENIIIPVSLQNTNCICGMRNLRNVTTNIALWTRVPYFASCPNIVPFIMYQPLMTKVTNGNCFGIDWSIGEVAGPSSWSQMYWPNVTEIFSKSYFYLALSNFWSLFSGSRNYEKTIDLMYLKNIERIDYYALQYTNIKAFVIDNENTPLIVRHDRDSEEIIENMDSILSFNSIWVSTGGWHWAVNTDYKIYVPDTAINDYKAAWSFYADVIHGISELNGGVKYATEADWIAAGKPIALIEEYMN